MLVRPITGADVVSLLEKYAPDERFIITFLDVLSSTENDDLERIWKTVSAKLRQPFSNQEICEVLRTIDQVIDLRVARAMDENIFLDIEDGDLIENAL
ncbi:hypothetical protein G3436_25695 [Pseudomonas sp. MAFF212427]|uniref:Uncharacterized protein n=1 Tax=Pseudomonas brassicae TaxID=2708063 RepID=A0A6B3P2P0_9PSED|nr:hypothetical protein [Pseudomonas brassicae]NER66628.1 hypothetical protein [Pseudomonas brassicae]